MERISPTIVGALNKSAAAKINYSRDEKNYILNICSKAFNHNHTLKMKFVEHLFSDGFTPTGDEEADLHRIKSHLENFDPGDGHLIARYLFSLLSIAEKALFKIESADDVLKCLGQSGFKPTYEGPRDHRRLVSKLGKSFAKTPLVSEDAQPLPNTQSDPQSGEPQGDLYRRAPWAVHNQKSMKASRLYASQTPDSDLLKQVETPLAEARAIVEDLDSLPGASFDDIITRPIMALKEILENGFDDAKLIVEISVKIVWGYADLSMAAAKEEQRIAVDACLDFLITQGFTALLRDGMTKESNAASIAKDIICAAIAHENALPMIKRIDADTKITLSEAFLTFTRDAWRSNKEIDIDLLKYLIYIFVSSFSSTQLDSDVLCGFMGTIVASRLNENFQLVRSAFKSIFFHGMVPISPAISNLLRGQRTEDVLDLALRYKSALEGAEESLGPLTEHEASTLRKQAIFASEIIALLPSPQK